MRAVVAAAVAAGLALATACMAHADPGNHSVNVSIVNGVATVVVDGVELHGAEAQPYIDAAKARLK